MALHCIHNIILVKDGSIKCPVTKQKNVLTKEKNNKK